MPSSITGVGIFLVFLIPGFVNYLQRRERVPQRSLSPLIEGATLLTVSVITDLCAFAVFALVRWRLRDHTPNFEQVVTRNSTYALHESGYLLLWASGLLAFSCALAFALGRFGSSFRLPGILAPLIVDASAWYQIFEQGPDGSEVYVGCDLNDGAYIGGTLVWYSTEFAENRDRDLALAPPFTLKADNEFSELPGFDRLILSANQIVRLYVSFIDSDEGGSV